ncbi:MAG: hypothetical protein AC479_07060 [miscellaneous Crenarchaeota group-6 archaeon AD8-1]|nr:MAG: hypothetical protein AC479_07060 [miscellaneous Crenarchaeota group-6 archaeon AD8-1]
MKNKFLKSTSIGLMIILLVLIANSSVVLAAAGPKSKTASLHYADIGTASINGIAGQPNLGFGCFDKKKTSGPGSADCIDIFGQDPTTGNYVVLGIATDSEEYKSFYDEVFADVFPPATLLEEEELEVWKHGTIIYVELTVPLDCLDLTNPTVPYVIPPFSMKIDSANQPYKAEIPLTPFPSGWTWSRITQRGYDAIVSFDCPTWGISGTYLGTTQFNSLDIFTPPST